MNAPRLASDSTERFSNRVDHYVAARPRYPAELVRYLESIGALRRGAQIVDVGVGTGLSSKPFLHAGYDVIGVEPNAEMRAAGETYLAQYERYRAVNGTAEATPLAAGTADLWIAGQAFHWFDALAARREAARILRAGGWAALFWNDRQTSTPFLAEYDALLDEFSESYRQIRRRHESDEAIATFMTGNQTFVEHLPHARPLHWNELVALLSSASYMPPPNTEPHAAVVTRLRKLYDRYANEQGVEMRYVCRVHAAAIDGSGAK